ncbi:MAG TPA: hypothetical protein VH482_25330 [Thermomicrobiales bacterium]|jgi:hypothetical protein
MGSPTLVRPLKVTGVRTYSEEYENLAHEAPILSSEVDADIQMLIDAWNNPASTFPVAIGATAPVSPVPGTLWWRTTDGNLYIFYNDGTTAQWVPAVASVGKLIGGQYYLVAGAFTGAPTASVSLGLYVAALAFTLPANLTGSQAVATVGATAQTDVDVRVNGVSKGSLRWAAGATVGGFVWTSAVSVAAGDRIELLAPATPDATLADVTWTLRGVL